MTEPFSDRVKEIFAEAVPLALTFASDAKPDQIQWHFGFLEKYAADATVVTPDHDIVAYLEDFLLPGSSYSVEAQSALDAIANDTNTIEPDYLKRIYAIVPDAPSLTLPARRTMGASSTTSVAVMPVSSAAAQTKGFTLDPGWRSA